MRRRAIQFIMIFCWVALAAAYQNCAPGSFEAATSPSTEHANEDPNDFPPDKIPDPIPDPDPLPDESPNPSPDSPDPSPSATPEPPASPSPPNDGGGDGGAEPDWDRLKAISSIKNLITEPARALATKLGFCEGPAWHPASNTVYFSQMDSASNPATAWSQNKGVFKPSFSAMISSSNGMAVGSGNDLWICGAFSNKLYRANVATGELETLDLPAKNVVPNDCVLDSMQRVWFTSPRSQEMYMYDGKTKSFKMMFDFGRTSDMNGNGIAISPDERYLYVATAGDRGALHRFQFDVEAGAVSNPQKMISLPRPDGIEVDQIGNIYAAGDGGIYVVRDNGQAFEGMRIQTSEKAVNLTFGDADWRTLYFTTTSGLYKVRLEIPGKPLVLQ